MNEFEWRLLEDRAPADGLLIAGVEVKPGDSVKLRPKAGGDIMDLALAGKVARVAAIEQDYEGKFQLAVVVDADPGKDLGMLRQPGHQFFFEPDEVEPYTPAELSADATKPHAKLLVAGIGNIFLGDDGFGVEVIKRLQGRVFPPEVQVADFGIRGFDLAYALFENYETAILIDACPRGDTPGTLYVIEPELDSIPAADASQPLFDAHGMNPMNVLRLVKSLGPDGSNKRILLLGCEPLTFGPEEGQLGLSDEVSAAVDGALALIDSLISRILAGENAIVRSVNP
jgi:hydrogenase maturation protease